MTTPKMSADKPLGDFHEHTAIDFWTVGAKGSNPPETIPKVDPAIYENADMPPNAKEHS